MMKPGLAKVLKFAALFVPLFASSIAVYIQVLPSYERLVLATANPALALFAPPSRLERPTDGGWVAYAAEPVATAGSARQLAAWPEFTRHLVFLSLALLPALLLATPAPWRIRPLLVAGGLVLLWIVHALTLVVLVRGKLCLIGHPGSFACLWMLRLALASGQISAAVLWGLLTWRWWIPRRALERGAA